ncbi:MAG: hypothetical protein ACTHN0_00545 [Aquihabitans sp.]
MPSAGDPYAPAVASTPSVPSVPGAGYSPATVGAYPPVPFGSPGGFGGDRAAESKIRATARGTSPLWYMLGAIAAVVLTWVVLIAALGTVSIEDETSSETGSAGLGLIVFVLALAVFVLVLLWLRQIGVNGGQFGGGLVFLAMLPWEALPFVGSSTMTSLGSMQARSVAALLATVVVVLLIRRPLIVGVWRAGHLPAPVLAEILWMLTFLGSVLFAGARAMAYLNPIEHSTAYYTSYSIEPNAGAVLVALFCSVVAGVGWLVTLLVVTIVQHVDISDARRKLREQRAA